LAAALLTRLKRLGIQPWMLVLAGILLLALVLRLWGIKYGLPFAYQIDAFSYKHLTLPTKA
jgi:hypothetical protein